MTKDDLNKLITYQLGNVTGQFDAIDLQIDAAIARLEQLPFQPWFLLSENNDAVTTIGERRLPVPEDFLGAYEEGSLYIEDVNGRMVPVAKKSQDELRPYYNDQGRPMFYSLTNKYFRLFPEPDAEYNMELMYYAKSLRPIDVDKNPWIVNTPDLLIYTVVHAMLNPRKDGNTTNYKALADEEYQKLLARHIAREEIDRDVVYGGTDLNV